MVYQQGLIKCSTSRLVYKMQTNRYFITTTLQTPSVKLSLVTIWPLDLLPGCRIAISQIHLFEREIRLEDKCLSYV